MIIHMFISHSQVEQYSKSTLHFTIIEGDEYDRLNPLYYHIKSIFLYTKLIQVCLQ